MVSLELFLIWEIRVKSGLAELTFPGTELQAGTLKAKPAAGAIKSNLKLI